MSKAIALSFCPTCNGVFQSRAFSLGFGGSVVGCSESCIFCGNEAFTETNPHRLKAIVVNVLKAKEQTAANTERLRQIFVRLVRNEISLEDAVADIDEVAPGLGIRILKAVKEHGLVIVPLVITALGIYAAFEANSISREANEISREALDFAINQAADQSVTTEYLPNSEPNKHIPVETGVNNSSPHRPVQKNRHVRRAEQAKKRGKK